MRLLASAALLSVLFEFVLFIFSSEEEPDDEDLFEELLHICDEDDCVLVETVLAGDVLLSLLLFDEQVDKEGVLPPSIIVMLLLFVLVLCISICSS